jgi:hypothetical protein
MQLVLQLIGSDPAFRLFVKMIGGDPVFQLFLFACFASLGLACALELRWKKRARENDAAFFTLAPAGETHNKRIRKVTIFIR